MSLPPRGPLSRPARALAAIEARDAEVNAFLTVRREAAGMTGIPLGVKDVFDTAGLRTTYGSAIYRDHVPEQTAQAVLRLERAGYVVVGKTNLHEFAYGITSENPHFGAVRNPLDLSRIAGGSSGGSAAALAAGMCDAALGTDTGGSIRIPAACCGVVGFKPTYGAVSTRGLFPLAPSFDHAGPMARTVPECAAAFTALTGRAAQETADLAGLRIGVLESFFQPCAPGIESAVRGVLARLPAAAPADDFPAPQAFDAAPMFLAEAAAVHRTTFPSRAAEYGSDVADRLARGWQLAAVDYLACREALAVFRERALAAFGSWDLLASPTLSCVAPALGTRRIELAGQSFTIRDLLTRNTRPFNNLGWPVLALPCGKAEDGLPASLSLIGRPGDDELVLAAGAALELASGAAPPGAPR
jgi:aspartyl-tRNA(Asn)/glutamyl-tRNA(Gln) amidotransferase subunit A